MGFAGQQLFCYHVVDSYVSYVIHVTQLVKEVHELAQSDDVVYTLGPKVVLRLE